LSELASKSQLRMAYLRFALFTVPLILLLGTISGRASNNGNDNAWFAALEKPAIMPPGWAFPVAWTILYIFLGLAIAIILYARGARGRGLAVTCSSPSCCSITPGHRSSSGCTRSGRR
jgi:benzodiazapine receptor